MSGPRGPSLESEVNERGFERAVHIVLLLDKRRLSVHCDAPLLPFELHGLPIRGRVGFDETRALTGGPILS